MHRLRAGGEKRVWTDGALSTTTNDLALYCAASADYAAITADVKPWQPS